MIWSLFTQTCKQRQLLNKFGCRFCYSDQTIIYIPIPMKKYNFDTFEEFLFKGNPEDINHFYKSINVDVHRFLQNKESVYIKMSNLDGKKNTHIQISNKYITHSHKVDLH